MIQITETLNSILNFHASATLNNKTPDIMALPVTTTQVQESAFRIEKLNHPFKKTRNSFPALQEFTYKMLNNLL